MTVLRLTVILAACILAFLVTETISTRLQARHLLRLRTNILVFEDDPVPPNCIVGVKGEIVCPDTHRLGHHNTIRDTPFTLLGID
jgi:hypothetical protein